MEARDLLFLWETFKLLTWVFGELRGREMFGDGIWGWVGSPPMWDPLLLLFFERRAPSQRLFQLVEGQPIGSPIHPL